MGESVQQTDDGGYLIAGETRSYGAGFEDVWLIKTDASGNKVWDKTFGGSASDSASSIQPTSDGNFIVVGHTQSYGAGNLDVWLIKVDEDGNKIWDKTYGGILRERGQAVQQTSDGGYIIAGTTNQAGTDDVYLIKTDGDGNKSWEKIFGIVATDFGKGVRQTADGEYIIIGSAYTYTTSSYDGWLIKTDANGNKVWDKTYGAVALSDWAYAVQQTADGGYMAVGEYGLRPNGDLWLFKTDASGNLIWNKHFGGDGVDIGYSLQETKDGGYVISGATESYGAGLWDAWLIMTDADGIVLWDKTFGGADMDWGYFAQETSDSKYILTGDTHSSGAGLADVWLVKADPPTLSEIHLLALVDNALVMSPPTFSWDPTWGESLIE